MSRGNGAAHTKKEAKQRWMRESTQFPMGAPSPRCAGGGHALPSQAATTYQEVAFRSAVAVAVGAILLGTLFVESLSHHCSLSLRRQIQCAWSVGRSIGLSVQKAEAASRRLAPPWVRGLRKIDEWDTSRMQGTDTQ